MSYLLNVALYAIWVQQPFAQDCGYGTIANQYDDSTGQQYCALVCYDEYFTNGETVASALSTASFNSIKAACPSIQIAIDQYGSCSQSNLVYPDACGCPYCSCDDTSAVNYHETQSLFTKSCTVCQCTGPINTAGQSVWMCSPDEYTVSTPHDWDHFSCNTAIACSSMDSSSHSPGESWFESISYDSTCQTFCYCQYDGTTYCETSYANIVSSSHNGLRAAFFSWDHCDQTKGCANQPDLLIQSSQYSCDCPKCACGEGKGSGDVEYIEYAETDYEDSTPFSLFDTPDTAYCLECTCNDYWGDGSDLRRNCDESAFESYVPDAQTCPPSPSSSTITCSEGDTNSSRMADADLTDVSCYGMETYCGWDYQYATDLNDNVLGDMFGDEYSWGCQESMFCDAFNVPDGGCVDITMDMGLVYGAMYSCHPNPQYQAIGAVYADIRMHMLQMCCSGDNCNAEDIDTSTCSVNSELNTWYDSYLQCLFGPDSQHNQWFCEHEGALDCDDLHDVGAWWFACDCDAFSDMYRRSGTNGQTYFEAEIADKMSSLNEWTELLGCELEFTCAMETGTLNINGAAVGQPTTRRPTTATPTFTPTSVTNNPTTTPTDATSNPTTAEPTEGTELPTSAPTAIPTDVTGAPTTAEPTTSEPTEVTTSPTEVTSSPSESPTCDADSECVEDDCEGECVEQEGCSVCMPQQGFANSRSIGVMIWFGCAVYAMQ